MDSPVNQKLIKLVTTIFNGYSLRGAHRDLISFSYNDLAKDIDVNTHALEALLENIESRNIIDGFGEDDGSLTDDTIYYVINFPKDFSIRVRNLIKELTELPPTTKKSDYDLKVDKTKGIFYISCNDKKFLLSKEAGTRRVNFIMVFSVPEVGTFKTINSVMEYISLPHDDLAVSEREKVIIIKNTLKEIQSIFKKNMPTVKPSLDFKTRKGFVALILKSG